MEKGSHEMCRTSFAKSQSWTNPRSIEDWKATLFAPFRKLSKPVSALVRAGFLLRAEGVIRTWSTSLTDYDHADFEPAKWTRRLTKGLELGQNAPA